MIHELLLRLDEVVPFYPPLAVGLVTVLVIVSVLRLLGRSRGTILFSMAAVLAGLGLAVGLVGIDRPASPVAWGAVEGVAERLVGPVTYRRWEQVTTASVLLTTFLLALVYYLATQERPGERSRRLLEQDKAQSATLGSAHLCNTATFRRWSRPDPWGWTLLGQFWGAKGQRIGTRFCLSGEDIARGVAVFGPQGSGKTQCVVLPAIADRMRDGHSLVITDVQGELQPYVEQIAAQTKHLVIVHDPSRPKESCRINLCDWTNDVADAQAMATVLLSGPHRGSHDPFWTRSAINLLAACALHYPSFGTIVNARRNLQQMASELKTSAVPGVADLAADFANSMATKDPRLALNIMATAFTVGLAPWADPALQAITDQTDLDLPQQLTNTPTVLILRCARRHTDAYGPYLGAILRVLTSRLDDLGQQAGGALPIPVGLILEEFPALGRLESLVRDINLVRKRRISVLTAAQSLAQFDGVYAGQGETEQLLAGLATRIVFGGCDGRTASYFSVLSGQQTVALSSLSRSRRLGSGFQDSSTASLHGRALLLPDDIIRPVRGHATVFAAYGEGGRAELAIFHARLTPFFQRVDWKKGQVQPQAPVALPRPAGLARPRTAMHLACKQADLQVGAVNDQDQWIVAQVEETLRGTATGASLAVAQELEIEV